MVHGPPQGLAEPGGDPSGVLLITFDDHLVVHGEDRKGTRVRVAVLPKLGESQLEDVGGCPLHRSVEALRERWFSYVVGLYHSPAPQQGASLEVAHFALC